MRQTNLLKRAMSVALGLVLGASALLAQNITVTGTVTDAMKEPIIGASILQQGTTNGTATDIDGNFTLSVPADALLEISSIGFETRVLKATAKMDVILVEDSEMLNETVVVGYGVQKRESLTGAITQIRSEDIAATKTADGVAALQGKIPGLLITQNSGKPGAFASEINLRGFGTPMVVVDGVVRSTTRTRKSTTWNQDPNALESYTDLCGNLPIVAVGKFAVEAVGQAVSIHLRVDGDETVDAVLCHASHAQIVTQTRAVPSAGKQLPAGSSVNGGSVVVVPGRVQTHSTNDKHAPRALLHRRNEAQDVEHEVGIGRNVVVIVAEVALGSGHAAFVPCTVDVQTGTDGTREHRTEADTGRTGNQIGLRIIGQRGLHTTLQIDKHVGERLVVHRLTLSSYGLSRKNCRNA